MCLDGQASHQLRVRVRASHWVPHPDSEGDRSGDTVTLALSPGETKSFVLTCSDDKASRSCSLKCSLKRVDLPASVLEERLRNDRDRSVKAGLTKDSLSLSEVMELSKISGVPFTDDEFFPASDLLNERYSESSSICWKRGSELFADKSSTLLENIQPHDAQQGGIGDCWLVSAVACLAEQPDRIRRIFSGEHILSEATAAPSSSSSAAAAASSASGSSFDVPLSTVADVYLYRMGLPERIRLDDLLPYSMSRGYLVYASRCRGALWPALVEKAFAKMHGGYAALVGGVSDRAFYDMTGLPSKRSRISGIEPGTSKADSLWQQLMQYYSRRDLLALGAAGEDHWSQSGQKPPSESAGMVTGHAYSLLRVAELSSGERLLQLRNPWGHFEWKGDWSDESDKWSSATEKELGLTREERIKDDGIFWMTFEDMLPWMDSFYRSDTTPLHRIHWKSEFIAVPGRSMTDTLRAPVFEVRFPGAGRQSAWIGIHQPEEPRVSMGMMVYYESDGARQVERHSCGCHREHWAELSFKGPTTVIVVTQCLASQMEELRSGGGDDEDESGASLGAELFEESEGKGGLVYPTRALRRALGELFWRLDKDLDGLLSEAELLDFVAQLPSAHAVTPTDILAKYDHTVAGLTKDGFIDLMMDHALAVSRSRESGILSLLEGFGYDASLQPVFQRPFVFTVHSSKPRPSLYVWPSRPEYAKWRKHTPPPRPADVIDPTATRTPSAESKRPSPAVPPVDSEAPEIGPPLFPPTFQCVTDREPFAVSLAVGDTVRRRRTVCAPPFEFGSVIPGSIGTIVAIEPDGVSAVVGFASDPRFKISLAELQRADWIEIGDSVRVRRSVKKPAFGWRGKLRHDDVGIVSEIDYAKNVATVRFEIHTGYPAKINELEWALGTVTQPSVAPGDLVRQSRMCGYPRLGKGMTSVGQIGRVSDVSDPDEVSVEWATQPKWRGVLFDVETAKGFHSCDHVELVRPSSGLPVGTSGMVVAVHRRERRLTVCVGGGRFETLPNRLLEAQPARGAR
jgi:hypothetical protein